MAGMASIEQRARDYRVVWREAGQKQHELFATREQAQQFADLVKLHGERWPYGWVKGHGFTEAPSGLPTFREWAERSISSRSTANERTRHDYKRDVRRHLEPTFGDMTLDRITPEVVGAWLVAFQNQKDGQGKKPSIKTIKNVHNLASSIMSDAVDHQLIGANPFRNRMRALPAVKQEEMVFLTRDEFEQLLPLIAEQYRPLVLCLAHTGLRWSEATALRVGDVDLMARRLNVVRAWKRTPEEHYVIGEPKSRRSRRTVVMSTRLAVAMAEVMEGKRAGDYVFTTGQGYPVRHPNFRYRTWVEATVTLEQATGKKPRIHDLRHSHASWLIAEKVSLPALQRRLGHESITTTVDRYGHLMPDVDDEIATAMDSWVSLPEPLAGELVPSQTAQS